MPHPRKPQATIDEINDALYIIKNSIANNQFKFIDTRKKNLDTLSALGFITKNVKDVILALSYQNYLNGPTDDRDFPLDKKSIWEFGYQIEETPLYLKIKITKINEVIAISFHIAEKPLYYHFAE